LIGLPGETVSEHGGVISINGKPLHENYVLGRSEDTTVGTWHVPKGHYFFMGDDRSHSCDSRTWGSVPRDHLVGPLFLTYWPPLRLSLH
jgi:signal peptidase I